MPSNHGDPSTLDNVNVIDDSYAAFTSQLLDTDQVLETRELYTEAQQTNFLFAAHEGMPHGTPQPDPPRHYTTQQDPPQKDILQGTSQQDTSHQDKPQQNTTRQTRKPSPIQNINNGDNSVIQGANPGVMQAQEGEEIPGDVGVQHRNEPREDGDGNLQTTPEESGENMQLEDRRPRKRMKRSVKAESTTVNNTEQQHTPSSEMTMLGVTVYVDTSNDSAQINALADFATSEVIRTLYPGFLDRPKKSYTELAAIYLSPSSPLGRLPSQTRERLFAQARREVVAQVEAMTVRVVQEARNIIKRMARNGELDRFQLHPDTVKALIRTGTVGNTQEAPPDEKASETSVTHESSRTSSAGQSHRSPPRQTLAPKTADIDQQTQASGTENMTSSSTPAPYATRIPLREASLSRGCLDVQFTHTEVPRHPLRTISSPYLQRLQSPNSQTCTISHPHSNKQKPLAIANHPKKPVAPEPLHYCPPAAGSSSVPVTTTGSAGPSNVQVTTAEILQAEDIAQARAASYEQTRGQLATAALNSPLAPPCALEHPRASVPPNDSAPQRQRKRKRNGRRLRSSKKASNYCHICGRCSNTVPVFGCANVLTGGCRKVLCEKCIIIHEPHMLQWARLQGGGWQCIHCRGGCPEKARCFQYRRNNQKRSEENKEKKRQTRHQQEEHEERDDQEEQEQQEEQDQQE